jgi:cyclopropane fatty-acyl-phospholipid synthase-like methyltransferase
MIGVYIRPETMSREQYQAASEKIQAAGVSQAGMVMHSCFSEGESLAIFDVWESKEAFEAFGAQLMPIVQEVGIVMGAPMIVEMIDYAAG